MTDTIETTPFYDAIGCQHSRYESTICWQQDNKPCTRKDGVACARTDTVRPLRIRRCLDCNKIMEVEKA